MTPSHHHPWFGTDNVLSFTTRPEQVRSLVRSELSDIGIAPQSVFSASPMVIPRSSYVELFRATSILLDLQRRVMLESGATTQARLDAFRVPDGEYPLFIDDLAVEERYSTAVCRPDIVIGPDGPKFVEFNVAGAAGGVVELHCLLRAWRTLAYRSAPAKYWAHDPFEASSMLFSDVCDEQNLPRAIALIGSLKDIHHTELSRYFDLEVDFLHRKGFVSEFIEPERLNQERTDFRLGLRHFTVYECRQHGVPLGGVADAMADGMLLVTTQTAAFLDNKKSMAMLSAGRPWMTRSELDTVAHYLPWTRVIEEGKTAWNERPVDLVSHVLEHQSDLIIKPGIGMQGMGVILGREVDAATWETVVETAAQRRDSIVQQYVQPALCPLDLTWDDDARVDRVDVAPVLSPFLFGGHWGGVFARFLATGAGGIVSQDTGGAQQNAVVAL